MDHPKNKKISRRQFIKGAATAVALPDLFSSTPSWPARPCRRGSGSGNRQERKPRAAPPGGDSSLRRDGTICQEGAEGGHQGQYRLGKDAGAGLHQ